MLQLFPLKEINGRGKIGHDEHGDQPEGLVEYFGVDHIEQKQQPKTC